MYSPSAPIGQLRGDAFIIKRGFQDRLRVSEETPFHVGDTIVVGGPSGRATLTYLDGTEMQLLGDLSLAIERKQMVRLDRGTLLATVAREVKW